MSEPKTTISSEEFEAGIPVHDALSAYQDAVAAQAAASAACLEWFKGLTLGQKAYVVMTQGHNYLGEDSWYCGHVHKLVDDGDGFPENGGEVSLYDELHWERHETKRTRDILEWGMEDWEGWNPDLSDKDNFVMYCSQLETAYGAIPAVARDLLGSNIKEAVFDW